MAELKGSKTHTNLKEAFAGESQANRRYLYFAKVADVEGHPDLAGLFRDTAEGETGHAHGHLDYLKRVGDPATGEPLGDTAKNLKAAIVGETYEHTQMYPGLAKTARDERFTEIAEWFVPLPPEVDARVALRELVGLDEHVVLHVGPHRIRAAFEPGRSTDERISAVQYARFPLSADARVALVTPGTPIAVEIDHPSYLY